MQVKYFLGAFVAIMMKYFLSEVITEVSTTKNYASVDISLATEVFSKL